MAELPAQLTWRDFVSVLKTLGYEQLKSKGGSARSFLLRGSSPPFVVTFHEPHGKATIRAGTLREYIRKLQLSKEDFIKALKP